MRCKQPQRRLAERRLRLPQIAREAEEANGLGGEIMSQRRGTGVLRAAQQVRQTLLPIEQTQAGGQIDPVPGLFELISLESRRCELPFENASGGVGADLGQGANLIDELRAGPHACFDRPFAAALEEDVKAPFDLLDRGLVEFAALEDLEMLLGDFGDGFRACNASAANSGQERKTPAAATRASASAARMKT